MPSLRTVACVAGGERGGGGGGGEGGEKHESPIPAPFSLSPYHLPVSTAAMQASEQQRHFWSSLLCLRKIGRLNNAP